MSKLIATLLLAAAAQVTGPPPVTRRDAPPPRTGTAVIRGRIIERDTNLPIVRIDVRLFRIGWAQPYTIRSDEGGRFEFTRLPAGQYQVSAEPPRNRPTHLGGAFSEKRVDPAGPARPLALTDGEVREGVDITLSRLVVISGRVLDEYGEPLSDIRVQAESLSRAQGLDLSLARDRQSRCLSVVRPCTGPIPAVRGSSQQLRRPKYRHVRAHVLSVDAGRRRQPGGDRHDRREPRARDSIAPQSSLHIVRNRSSTPPGRLRNAFQPA